MFDNSRLMTTAEYDLVCDDVRRYKLKIERQIKAKQKKEEEARKAKKNNPKPSTSITTQSRAHKLPSSSSSSSSESDNETLDLERIMDEGVLHNTNNQTSEDIMQKPNDENALDIATASKDHTKDITGALTENNIMQQSTPTDQPATKTSDAGESDHTDGDEQQDEGNDIVEI